MKYSTRDLPPPTVDRDFAHRAPDRTPRFRDYFGAICFMAAVFCNVFFLLGG